jgi:hypothetical protein
MIATPDVWLLDSKLIPPPLEKSEVALFDVQNNLNKFQHLFTYLNIFYLFHDAGVVQQLSNSEA